MNYLMKKPIIVYQNNILEHIASIAACMSQKYLYYSDNNQDIDYFLSAHIQIKKVRILRNWKIFPQYAFIKLQLTNAVPLCPEPGISRCVIIQCLSSSLYGHVG